MNNLVLVNKDSNKIYDIYDITYNKTGHPLFLIYKDNQWIRIKAKYFRPAEAHDYNRLLNDQFIRKYITTT